jgi:hypothetical protein
MDHLLPPACPACRADGVAGGARMGNRRASCRTCNAFAQAVLRLTRARLARAHPEQYATIRADVERELWPAVVAEYSQRSALQRVPAAPPRSTGEKE